MGGAWRNGWAILRSIGPGVIIAGQTIAGVLAVLGLPYAAYKAWTLEKWVEAKAAPIVTAATGAMDEAKAAAGEVRSKLTSGGLPDLTAASAGLAYLPLVAAAIAAYVAIKLLEE